MAFWSKTKEGSKVGFDKVYNLVDKLGAPVNRLSNKVGSEAFWPTTLDIESDKAARILKSFCSEYNALVAPSQWLIPQQRMATTRKKTVRPWKVCPRESKEYSRRSPPR
jgi:hypothetical protein